MLRRLESNYNKKNPQTKSNLIDFQPTLESRSKAQQTHSRFPTHTISAECRINLRRRWVGVLVALNSHYSPVVYSKAVNKVSCSRVIIKWLMFPLFTSDRTSLTIVSVNPCWHAYMRLLQPPLRRCLSFFTFARSCRSTSSIGTSFNSFVPFLCFASIA